MTGKKLKIIKNSVDEIKNFIEILASHCVRKRLYVVLGEHNLNVKEGNEIEFRIQTAIKHPKYNKKTVDSDIAMLK